MAEGNSQPQQQENGKSRFLEFRSIPYGTKRDGELVLNRYSSHLTNGYEFPGAQAMLYAAGVKSQEDMRKKPQVGTSSSNPPIQFLQSNCKRLTLSLGVASVWWEGNPCKYGSNTENETPYTSGTIAD